MACADFTDPPLSTVEQPTYEIGRTAAELLGARIKGDNSPPKIITLASSLRVRGSSLRGKAPNR
jgi:LacI family transcriptional regulator